jgi:hypothetical protein
MPEFEPGLGQEVPKASKFRGGSRPRFSVRRSLCPVVCHDGRNRKESLEGLRWSRLLLSRGTRAAPRIFARHPARRTFALSVRRLRKRAEIPCTASAFLNRDSECQESSDVPFFETRYFNYNISSEMRLELPFGSFGIPLTDWTNLTICQAWKGRSQTVSMSPTRGSRNLS